MNFGSFGFCFQAKKYSFMWKTRQEMALIDITSSAGYSVTYIHTTIHKKAAFFMFLIETNEKSVMLCFLN